MICMLIQRTRGVDALNAALQTPQGDFFNRLLKVIATGGGRPVLISQLTYVRFVPTQRVDGINQFTLSQVREPMPGPEPRLRV